MIQCETILLPLSLLKIQSSMGKLSISRGIVILFKMTTTREVAIEYISTSKTITDPLSKLISIDAFKAHAMSLGLRRT